MLSYLSGASPEQLKRQEEQLNAIKESLSVDTISNFEPLDPRTSEDCLFLDVMVSEDTFNQKKASPVLVWIHGGGYVAGHKSSAGNPENILMEAQSKGEGIVFVTMNYRLGLFGWLSGPTYRAEDGLPNAGLFDQRLALKWVQQNVHLFGGDPSRVTVMGESAGAGSIMHHITSWGSSDENLFQQAILQSPGYYPIVTYNEQEKKYKSVISQAQNLIDNNITTISDLKNLDFISLTALNRIIVAKSAPYGTFSFGPVVDGTYVPELPSVLMRKGKSKKSLNVLTAHNSDEGYIFTSPFLDDTFIASQIAIIFPSASDETRSYMLENIWPPIYDGSQPYLTPNERASLLISELTFSCYARYTALAYPNSSFSYVFAVPPGYHSIDVAYTFYNVDNKYVNSTVARKLQSIIINFVQSGTPNGPDVAGFPPYLPDSKTLVLSNSSVDSVQTDTAANYRCSWLQNTDFSS